MDLKQSVEAMKEQGFSAKRALFNLKIRNGIVTHDMMDIVKSVYQLSDDDVKYILGWFPQLKDKVIGKHTLIVCGSCHKGDQKYIDSLSAMIQTPVGGLSEDKLFSLEVTGCMGLCALGPNATINRQNYRTKHHNTDPKN